MNIYESSGFSIICNALRKRLEGSFRKERNEKIKILIKEALETIGC